MSDDGARPLRKLEALSAIRDDRTYSKEERLVLVMLISHASARDGSSFPSLELLAAECDMGRGRVHEAISSLLKRTDGPIQLTKEHRARTDGAGGRTSNLYRVRLRPTAGTNPNELSPEAGTNQGEGLSPRAGGVESPNPGGVESHGGTGSSTGSTTHEARQVDLARAKPVRAMPPAFALEPPKATPKRTKPEPDPNVNVLRAHHHAEHVRLIGREPVYTSSQHAAAGKAWKELLSVRDVEVAKAIITAGIATEGGFYVDPWAILKGQNKLASGPSGARRTSRYQPQATTPELANLGRAAGAALTRPARAVDDMPNQIERVLMLQEQERAAEGSE